jgi:pheromone shutdown protein TraB
MLKQAYLRVWVYAAFETLEAFLQTLEEELEERNGWMAKNIARTLHSGKKAILIAGSEHFHPMISGFKEEQVENPVLTFLNDNHRHYLILQPAHDEMLDQAKEIREEFQDVIEAATSDLEREAVRLCEYLIEHEDELATNKKMSRSLDDLKQLKEACIAIVEDVEIESHEQALKRPYMTGAICLRIDKVAKTIQIWNVIAEVALAQAEWLDESRDILGLNH